MRAFLPGKLIVRRGRKSDANGFLWLLAGFARFERLEPPSRGVGRRVVRDIFDRKLANLFVAISGGKHVGYALYFYTYSSFLGRPVFYLEDIFVLKVYRGTGLGRSLFLECVREAQRKGCGRMEWRVLAWNKSAAGFYEKLGAMRLSNLHTYRLDSKNLRRLSKIKRHD